jgi:hypothetical protein
LKVALSTIAAKYPEFSVLVVIGGTRIQVKGLFTDLFDSIIIFFGNM